MKTNSMIVTIKEPNVKAFTISKKEPRAIVTGTPIITERANLTRPGNLNSRAQSREYPTKKNNIRIKINGSISFSIFFP